MLMNSDNIILVVVKKIPLACLEFKNRNVFPLKRLFLSSRALRSTSSLARLGSSIWGLNLSNTKHSNIRSMMSIQNIALSSLLFRWKRTDNCKGERKGDTPYFSALGSGSFCCTALLNALKNSGFTKGRQHSNAQIVCKERQWFSRCLSAPWRFTGS